MNEVMHHRIDNFWKLEYQLKVADNSVLLYSVGETDEARYLCNALGLKEAVAGKLEELPLIFGETLTGNPTISGNEAKGIFRHFISASLTAKNHKICVPSTKRHVEEDRESGGKKYYIPTERLEQCLPEKLCFVCQWFGTTSFESQLSFGFLSCDKAFKDVISNIVPMVAIDEQFGGPAGGSLASTVGVKAGTEFRGEIIGLNLNQVILGGLYDVTKASESGVIKFGRHRSRGFGSVKLTITKLSKYSVAPFREDETYDNEKLKGFLEGCLEKYSSFAKIPSQPVSVTMKLVEQR